MESLPPIAPMPRSICASGHRAQPPWACPQRSGTSRKRSKYSWKERYAASRVKPAATRRATLSRPRYMHPELVFLHDEGIEAHAMALAVLVSPSTGNFATIACAGVSWRSPPNGMSTVAAPNGGVETLRPGPCSSTRSNRSPGSSCARQPWNPPNAEHRARPPEHGRPDASARHWCRGNSREISTIASPFHVHAQALAFGYRSDNRPRGFPHGHSR